MKAVIFAAGRGTRLGPAYQDRPKILLTFGGRSLLAWHVERLAAVGVRELVVVTGFEREQIRAALEELRGTFPLAIREVVNLDFAEGSVLSFHASLGELRGAREPVLLMDGDVLYPAEMLRRLVQSPHRTALLVDREYSTTDDDPVLVPVREGRPADFRKQWTGEAEWVGESVGFFKVDPQDLPLLVEATERRSVGSGRAEPYEEVIRDLVLAGRFGCEDVTGLPWTEIDFPEDVERAEREILPAIVRLPG